MSKKTSNLNQLMQLVETRRRESATNTLRPLRLPQSFSFAELHEKLAAHTIQHPPPFRPLYQDDPPTSRQADRDAADSLRYAALAEGLLLDQRPDLKRALDDAEKAQRRMQWRQGQKAIDILQKRERYSKLIRLERHVHTHAVVAYSKITGEELGRLDGHAYIVGGEERLMGIMDDLARLARGDGLKNLMGMHDVGDRVALDAGLWAKMQTRNVAGAMSPPRDADGHPYREYRTGTIVNITAAGEESVVATVQHDSGDTAVWDVLALLSMDRYLVGVRNGTAGKFRCTVCADTGWPDGQPENGECECQQIVVDFTESDADFAARRRAMRRKA